MGENCKSSIPVPRKPPTVYVHIVVIGTVVLLYCLLLFSLTAPLSMEDMPGGAQTYLGGAHRHFESCYAGFGHIMHNLVAITSPNHA
jgi:hypothetical protein